MGAESLEDCIADVPSLYQAPMSAQASYGHGTQAPPAASATIIPSPDLYSGIYPPLHFEAQSGCTVGTHHSPYRLRDPEGHTSDVPDHHASLMCTKIGTSVAGNSSIGSQSTGHKRGQGASFALPLPTRTKNLCDYLPSQDADSRSESGSPDVATMYDHQPRGFEATYDIGPAYADSIIDPPDPYLVPYTEAQSGFAFSSDPGIVNVPGHETPAGSQITSPYPRQPSNHASFLPYPLP